MRRILITVLIIIGLAWAGCKEPFDAKLGPGQTNFLVVEGFINTAGQTTINLSRSLSLKERANIKPELNAQVTVTGEDNSVYNVKPAGNGTYVSDVLNLRSTQKYRLRIKTASGGDYLSDFTAVMQTPPIDSINWKLQNNGVQIFANTHDPQNNTRYYKWEYEETWEINSSYSNYVKYVNGRVIPRDLSEIPKLFYCWKTQNFTSILVGSSAQLTNDVINLAPMVFIPIESEKLGVRYSILVRQVSLDRPAYQFYQLMKSNTEALGSVFDPLPSEITGNIHCVSNPSEKVIGYVTASTVVQKRIFISRSDVAGKYANDCQSTYVKPDSLKFYVEMAGLLPYDQDGYAPAPVSGYYLSFPSCISCLILLSQFFQFLQLFFTQVICDVFIF